MSYADEMIEALAWGGGKCQACDTFTEVNDMSLCDDCDEKIQRDMIRDKEWDYVVEAFGLSNEGRDKLYQDTIKKHGRKKELTT